MSTTKNYALNKEFGRPEEVTYKIPSLFKAMVLFAAIELFLVFTLFIPAKGLLALLFKIFAPIAIFYVPLYAINVLRHKGTIIKLESNGVWLRTLFGNLTLIPWDKIEKISPAETPGRSRRQKIITFKTADKTWVVPEVGFNYSQILSDCSGFSIGQRLTNVSTTETRTVIESPNNIFFKLFQIYKWVNAAILAFFGIFLFYMGATVTSNSGPVEVFCDRPSGSAFSCRVVHHRFLLPNQVNYIADFDGIGSSFRENQKSKKPFTYTFYLIKNGQALDRLWSIDLDHQIISLAEDSDIELKESRELRNYFHNPEIKGIQVKHASTQFSGTALFLMALGLWPIVHFLRRIKKGSGEPASVSTKTTRAA